MTLDIRGRYLLSFMLVVFGIILVADAYLEYALGEWLESRLLVELHQHAKTWSGIIEAQERVLTRDSTGHLERILKKNEDLRVTLIAADGEVLGDSQREVDALRAMGNHGQRPEILAAIREGFGWSKHYSETLSKQMLYVAVPFHYAQGSGGVVRVATSMESVQSIKDRLHMIVVTTAFIIFLVSITLSGFSAHWSTRTQRRLIAYAKEMLRSKQGVRIELHAKDALSGLAGALNFLADEKQEAMDRLSAQQSQMSTVLQSMHEGVISLDEQHCIVLINHSALALFRLSQPPLGQDLATVLSSRTVVELGLDRENLPVPLSVEFDLAGPPPGRVIATVARLQTHRGHVVVFRDVTEKYQLDMVRRDFIANVSHELRTPVSVMKANAQILLDGALEDEQYRRIMVDAMERNASRLDQIISDLMELSLLENNQFVMEWDDIPLFAIVQEMVDLVRAAADRKQIFLQVALPPDLLIHADAEMLRRILTNFLNNAIKYTPEHSMVVVRTGEKQGRLRLEVVDNGPGIAPHHRHRLFERFYRVDTGRSRREGGTGLGLSIVKHLAEKMGETVGVEAVEPQGSLFWVTISPPPEAGDQPGA